VGLPQGCRAGAKPQHCEERAPNGPVWERPWLLCCQRGTAWRLGYLSNWEAPPPCPQLELLSEAGPGLGGRAGRAGSHVRWQLAVPAPLHWLGNCLHPLQCPLGIVETDFLLLFTKHGIIPSPLSQDRKSSPK